MTVRVLPGLMPIVPVPSKLPMDAFSWKLILPEPSRVPMTASPVKKMVRPLPSRPVVRVLVVPNPLLNNRTASLVTWPAKVTACANARTPWLTNVSPVQEPETAPFTIRLPEPFLVRLPVPRFKVPPITVLPSPSTVRLSLAKLVTLFIVSLARVSTLKVEVPPALSRVTLPKPKVEIARNGSKLRPLTTFRVLAPIDKSPSC